MSAAETALGKDGKCRFCLFLGLSSVFDPVLVPLMAGSSASIVVA
ncbi:hypothetical protein [Halotia branconii]|uniref:Uncharacterized protein n=1 Tax=Halotia branconii CENA392 TaxID=1539056 RepID=A0AAJ6NN24_9CYAN|nr:hypothetical protein [Halotia branconii]WGV23462.1 hypothetical protein QI031_16690 [Halotia branconii CENA392]